MHCITMSRMREASDVCGTARPLADDTKAEHSKAIENVVHTRGKTSVLKIIMQIFQKFRIGLS